MSVGEQRLNSWHWTSHMSWSVALNWSMRGWTSVNERREKHQTGLSEKRATEREREGHEQYPDVKSLDRGCPCQLSTFHLYCGVLMSAVWQRGFWAAGLWQRQHLPAAHIDSSDAHFTDNEFDKPFMCLQKHLWLEPSSCPFVQKVYLCSFTDGWCFSLWCEVLENASRIMQFNLIYNNSNVPCHQQVGQKCIKDIL